MRVRGIEAMWNVSSFVFHEGDDIRKISDPKLTRSRGSGAPGVKSYKKVEIFVARVVPLEIVLLRSRQRQLVTDTFINALKL